MIINSQRTMYNVNLTINMLLGNPHRELPNTTLNEKFNILPLEEIPDNTYPKLDYIVVGIGGTELIDDSPYKFSKHKSIDASLFETVPFIVRPLNQDILPEKRKNYRLRTIINVNGVNYIAYYAKKFTNYILRDGLYEIESVNNIHTLKFMSTNTNELLNPTPRLANDYLDIENKKYNAKTVKVEFSLTTDEMIELENSMSIVYGKIVPITEIGLATGIDKVLADGNTEATNVVISFFVEVNLDTKIYIMNNKQVLRNIEIGSLEFTVA